MTIQTDGFVLGDLPNEEHYRCLMCGEIPRRVHVDVFVPEPGDIPVSPLDFRNMVLPYRLCPRCHGTKPEPWKIRLLLLERLSANSPLA